MREVVGYQVNVTIEKRDVNAGKVREVVRVHNRVTDVGLNAIRDFLAGDSVMAPSHFALGTGTTDPASGDVSLETEVFRDVLTQITKAGPGLVQYKYYLSSQDANGHTLAEAGLFNAAAGGDLYARVTFPADEKTNAEAWTITWDIQGENA